MIPASHYGTRRTVTNLRRSEEIRLRSEESIMLTRQQLRSRGRVRGRRKISISGVPDRGKRSSRLRNAQGVISERRRVTRTEDNLDQEGSDLQGLIPCEFEEENEVDTNSTPSPIVDVPITSSASIDAESAGRQSQFIREHWSHLSLKRYKQFFNLPCRSVSKVNLLEAVSRHFPRIDVCSVTARKAIASRFLQTELPRSSSQDCLESSSGPLEEGEDDMASDFLEYD